MNLTEYLTQNYPKIAKAIASEGYNIDYEEFDEIVEIGYEDDIVGFISLAESDFFNTKVITDTYIIDEYRGNNLFFKKFMEYLTNNHSRILFKKPSYAFMEVLIHNGLAYKFSDDFAVSFINFTVTLKDAYKNSNIKRLYKKISPAYENTNYLGDLFDLKRKCVVINDSMEVMVKDFESFVIIEPRKYDLKKYSLRKKLKKITPSYMDEVGFNYGTKLNSDDARELLNETFNPYFTLDNIIGSDSELKSDFVEFIKQKGLEEEDAFKIRKSIEDSLNDGEITAKSIIRRLTFLADNIEKIDEDLYEKPLVCPFCKSVATNQIGMCKECGHEFDESFPDDDLFEILDSGEPDSFFDDDREFSVKDNDFMEQFHDFSEKLDALLGGDRDEFFNSIEEGDFLKARELMGNADENLKNVDWYVEKGNRLDNGTLKLIDEKGYDEAEVFDAQCRIAEYELVKHVRENITSWKAPEYGRLNHIDYDYYQACLNKGYLEEIDSDEFKFYFKKYSVDELEEELKYFDIEAEPTKEGMIRQLAEAGSGSLVVTDKGIEYLNSNLFYNFFATNLSEYFFYEFEIYYKENQGNIVDIADKYVNSEFKQEFVKGNLDAYLSYLDYYYSMSFFEERYEDAVYYLLQRFIYEANRWDRDENHRPLDRIFSRKTQKYFNDIFLIITDIDFDEIYEKAYRQFKFSHMKNHKELLKELSRDLIIKGEHMVVIRDQLVDELFE